GAVPARPRPPADRRRKLGHCAGTMAGPRSLYFKGGVVMRKTWVLVSVLGMALAGRASAAPSLYGPTGLLVIPTADTLAQQSWNAHVHAVDTGGATLTTFGANFGIAKQLELGVTGFHVKVIGTKALFNAKYAV